LYDTTNDQVPDKNDIVTAFAAAYDEQGTGDTIFYFGLDTYSVQGAANAGFWFFRDRVQLNPLEPGATTGTFDGDHTEGDIFVSVSYEQGGKVGLVEVYTWDATLGPGNKPNGPQLLLTSADADCANAPADDDVCGVINLTPGEDPPWNYLNKNGDPTYESAAFVEFGLNISALLGENIGCFSTFLAETRSAPSLTSQLKDFALGEFPVCGIDVVKEVDELAKVGDEVNYSITVENTGRAPLYKQSITDTLNTNPPTVTDLTNNDGCPAVLAAGETCTISYTRTVLANDPDPLENTVEIVYTEFQDPTSLEFTDEYTATTNLFQPDIALDKTVKDATGTYVDGPITVLQGVTVNYKAVLTDESSDDTPPLDCTTTDPNLPGLNGTVIPLTTTASLVTIPANLTWCTLNGAGSLYTCVNTVTSTCTIPDVCEDPQNPTPETCLSFDNELEKTDSVTVNVQVAELALTVSKKCDDFSKPGDTVNCEVEITNESAIPLTLDSIVDENDVPETRDLTDPNVYDTSDCPTGEGTTLAVDASCTITYSRETLETDPDVINNEVTVSFSDAFGGTGSQSATDDVTILHPSYNVTKDCIPPDQFPVPPGTFVSFRIDTENTGDADLVLTSVADNLLGELLAPAEQSLPVVATPPCTEENFEDGVDGCYRIEQDYEVTEDVSNLVDVHAKLAATYDLPNTFTESDDAFCDVEEVNITRTMGFWRTHGSDGEEFLPPEYPIQVAFGYTCYVAEYKVGFPILLTNNGNWKTLMDCGDVFGMFWESKAQCSNLEQAKIQASRQFLAAILNDAAFGTPIPEDCKKKAYQGLSNDELFDAMRDALDGNSRRAINSLGSVFACYNESEDTGAIVDTVPVPHADPRGTRAVADFDLVTCGK
jgi:uncharacterized repeat protein (TIGR01451 family)